MQGVGTGKGGIRATRHPGCTNVRMQGVARAHLNHGDALAMLGGQDVVDQRGLARPLRSTAAAVGRGDGAQTRTAGLRRLVVPACGGRGSWGSSPGSL